MTTEAEHAAAGGSWSERSGHRLRLSDGSERRPIDTAPRWPGCHGWVVRPEKNGGRLGWMAADPGRTATLRLGRGRPLPPRGDVLWRVVPPGDAIVAELRRTGRDRYEYRSGRRGRAAETSTQLSIDVARAHLAGRGPLAAQLRAVTTIGLPLLAQTSGALVLHAAGFAPPDGPATVVCGASGVGKSSLCSVLVGALGWLALSDDVCIIEGTEPEVWPGPRWTRLRTGERPYGKGWKRIFADATKTAWDLAGSRAERPLPVGRLVVLHRAAGATLEWRALSLGDALRFLARHAPWLLLPADGPRSLFPALVHLTRTTPAFRLGVPGGRDWPRRAAEHLAATTVE